jgi:uncharacterized membrane protein
VVLIIKVLVRPCPKIIRKEMMLHALQSMVLRHVYLLDKTNYFMIFNWNLWLSNYSNMGSLMLYILKTILLAHSFKQILKIVFYLLVFSHGIVLLYYLWKFHVFFSIFLLFLSFNDLPLENTSLLRNHKMPPIDLFLMILSR